MKKGWEIAYGSMWFETALAVIAGLYFTHSIHCLWFMLIPTIMRFRSISDDKTNDKGEE